MVRPPVINLPHSPLLLLVVGERQSLTSAKEVLVGLEKRCCGGANPLTVISITKRGPAAARGGGDSDWQSASRSVKAEFDARILRACRRPIRRRAPV